MAGSPPGIPLSWGCKLVGPGASVTLWLSRSNQHLALSCVCEWKFSCSLMTQCLNRGLWSQNSLYKYLSTCYPLGQGICFQIHWTDTYRSVLHSAPPNNCWRVFHSQTNTLQIASAPFLSLNQWLRNCVFTATWRLTVWEFGYDILWEQEATGAHVVPQILASASLLGPKSDGDFCISVHHSSSWIFQ